MVKQKNIPALRFPTFSGGWDVKKLGAVVKINQGLQIPISERYTEQVAGSYFYITNEFLKVGSAKKFYIKNPTHSVLCTKDDILMTRTGNTGMVVTNVDGAFHNNFFKVAYPDFLCKNYLYNFLKLEKIQAQILKMAGTSTIPDLNHSDFYRIEIAYPTLPEQIIIATFLTAVDDKIRQLTKKKELMQQYKKGVMHQIFNQTVRFKDDYGNVYPAWKEVSFNEIYSFKKTNSYSRENLNYENGLVRNIHYGDIHTKFQVLFDLTKERVPFLNPAISTQNIPEDSFCREGDLVIADASEDYADVGKSIEIVNLNTEKTISGLHTLLARPDISKMEIGFGGYLMKSYKVRNQIMTIAQGSKVLSISFGRLSEIILNIPCGQEQMKIVNFLTSIDDKINSVSQVITQTQAYKKGLLQQMFI